MVCFILCHKLKYLNLSNFNTSHVKDMSYMLGDCVSLRYINLRSFKLNGEVEITGIFKNVNPEAKYCIEDDYTKNLLLKDRISYCSDDCFNPNIKIDLANITCIKSCLYTENPFEYAGTLSPEEALLFYTS